MATLQFTFTPTAPHKELTYFNVSTWAHDMSQGVYVQLTDGTEIIFNPMFVFAVAAMKDKEDDKGRT
jgi:hypothetical protein